MQLLVEKLHDRSEPHAALARLLVALGAHWREQGKAQARHGLAPALVAGLEGLWQGLGPARLRALPQQPRLLQLMNDLAGPDRLLEFAGPPGPHLLEPAWAPVTRILLRQARQHRLLPLATGLLDALAAAWRPSQPWANDMAMLLGMLVREADTLEALRRIHRWAQPVHAALDQPSLPPDLRNLLLRRLPQLASRTLDVAAMRRLCRIGPVGLENLEDALNWVPMLTILHHFDPLAPVDAVLQRVVARYPNEPRIQMLRARMLADSGTATAEQLVALIEPLRPSSPGYAKAALWLARNLFYLDAEHLSLAWYRRAAEAAPLPEADAARQAHLSVKLAPEPEQAQALADELEVLRLRPEEHGALAPGLQLLAPLMNHDPEHGSEPDAAEMQRLMDASLQSLAELLPTLGTLNAQAALSFARAICSVADTAYQRTAQFIAAIPVPTGPQYGTLDPYRCKVMLDGVARHAVLVGTHVLAQPGDWLAGINHLRVVFDLVDLLVDRLLRLEDAPAALDLLARVQAQLGISQASGGVGDAVLWGLVQRCRLDLGELDSATQAGQLAGQGDQAEVLGLQHWPAWAAGQGGEHQLLIDEPVRHGSYDYIRGDGVVHTVAHWIPAVRMATVQARGLLVRNSYALVAAPAAAGAAPAMLLPEPWHLSMGSYPYRHANVLERGRRGTAMLKPAAAECIDEPVVVLGNMDAIVHRNYYHWMLLILARINALQRRGLLDQRRLLVPEELSVWMTSSLELIGLRPEQMRPYKQEQDLLLADALVVQPVEFTSTTLVTELADTLQAAALANPELPEHKHPLVFISRRQAMDRPLIDEDEIMAVAERMGFFIVEPELLNLAEQVKLFGNARGIAAPPGAGFSNLMFAGAGARVLSIFKEEESQATFVDLSLVRGQQHRWLLGRTEAEFRRTSMLNGPYRVNLDLVKRELAWVAEVAA
ncbi:MAG TPA: glycosyltransferase family 61 protein [Ideonella sp.]|nr:glycosyltransferase family 61 protein [Ideonella sp.]